MASTAKRMEVLFDSVVETHEKQSQMMDLVDTFKPSSADMQSAGNTVWRPYQQHAPILDGWDLTGQETDIIETAYPAALGTPVNDYFKQRADDMRDLSFWENRGKESGKRQASELNKRVANLVKDTGSLFYRSNVTSGYDFVAEAQAQLNERQLSDNGRCFALNDRDTKKFASDLAGRQTLQGKPAEAWNTGQIGSNIAQFDVYTGSYLPNLAGGANPNTTVTGDQSFAPEAGTVSAAGAVVTNVDHRIATIAVAASGSYNVGDKVTFDDVYAIGLADKTVTGQLMTFTIVAKPNGTSVSVYPKPIALDDPGLSTLEQAYANINTQILNGVNMVRLNTDVSAQTNAFWAKDSLEITVGDAPLQLLNEFGGMKVVSHTLKSGLTLYMAYDGNIDTLQFKCRLFSWYGLTNKNPSANGIAVTY